MVGMDLFLEYFRGWEDCYTLIGGAACDILMADAALEFRATKDIDMILLAEDRFPEFAAVFWGFIKAGGYRCGQRGGDRPCFYRFLDPADRRFPVMIELFSRRPELLTDRPDLHLTRLPLSEELSSLSAIMLDEDYYRLMLAGRKTVAGLPVLGAEQLMLFKAKAHLDLRAQKLAGARVDERNIRKHKNDLLRLYAIADPAARIPLPAQVAADLRVFLELLRTEPADLRAMGLGSLTLEELLTGLGRIFIL